MNEPVADSLSTAWLSNGLGEQYLPAVNGRAFHRIGSDAVFRRQFGEGLWKEDTLYWIIGTDSLLLVRYILKHGPPKGSRYLFLELPEVLDALAPQLERLELGDRLLILPPDQWEELRETCEFNDYLYLGNTHILESLGAVDAQLPAYRKLGTEFRRAWSGYAWQVNYRLGSDVFFRAQLRNLGENRRPAKALEGHFQGKTAVLLGGGPSLDELLPWVRTHQDQVVIFAVSRIARRLQQVGLEPHILVSIDPHDISFEVSREMLEAGSDALFVNAHHVSPRLLGQWRGASAYLGPRYPWNSERQPPNLSLHGPTVTNTALQLAVAMGFSQVVLVGVDLCYSASGHSHAKGSNEHQAGPVLGVATTQIETNAGDHADTGYDFAAAIDAMTNQATRARAQGCQVINAAPGAAAMEAVEFQPADTIIIDPLATPAAEILAQCWPEEHREQRLEHYREVIGELQRVHYRLGKIRRLALEALECNDGLFGRQGKTAHFKYKRRMDRIEQRLDEEYADLSPVVKQFGSRRFVRLNRPDWDAEWSDQEIEDWGRGYYATYRDATGDLIELIEEAKGRIQDRIAEEQDPTDFERLARRWRDDGQPGRSRVWAQRNPRAAEAADCNELETQYQNDLHQQDTAHARRSQYWADLRPVRGKALTAFRARDAQSLERLHLGLARRDADQADTDQATELRHLIRGYQSELANDPTAALDAYQQVTKEPQVEDALRRIAHLTLDAQDVDNALLTYDCLTSLSPAYAPQYAELLRVAGRVQEAMDLYTEYLKWAPTDLATLFKLARLYQDCGVPEAARWAYRHIVEQDPQNDAARTLLEQLPDAPQGESSRRAEPVRE